MKQLADYKGADFKNFTLQDRLEFAQAVYPDYQSGAAPDELMAIQAGLEVCKKKFGKFNIVETGMGWGTSSRFFLSWVIQNGGQYHSIERKVQPGYLKQLEDLGIREHLILHEADTQFIEWDRKIPIHFLWIDTEHAFSGALLEYLKFRAYAAHLFVVGFHDTMACTGVRRAIQAAQEMDWLSPIVLNRSVANMGAEVYQCLQKDKPSTLYFIEHHAEQAEDLKTTSNVRVTLGGK